MVTPAPFTPYAGSTTRPFEHLKDTLFCTCCSAIGQSTLVCGQQCPSPPTVKTGPDPKLKRPEVKVLYEMASTEATDVPQSCKVVQMHGRVVDKAQYAPPSSCLLETFTTN